MTPAQFSDDAARFTEPTLIGEVGSGAKLIAFGLRVMVVEPDRVPRWVTPTGLVPINMPPPA